MQQSAGAVFWENHFQRYHFHCAPIGWLRNGRQIVASVTGRARLYVIKADTAAKSDVSKYGPRLELLSPVKCANLFRFMCLPAGCRHIWHAARKKETQCSTCSWMWANWSTHLQQQMCVQALDKAAGGIATALSLMCKCAARLMSCAV